MRALSLNSRFFTWTVGPIFLLASAGAFGADDKCATLKERDGDGAVRVVSVGPVGVAMSDDVRIGMKNLRLLLDCEHDSLKNLTLYLNGRPIKNLAGTPEAGDALVFKLRRNVEAGPEWAALLGGPKWGESRRTVDVAVGPNATGATFAAIKNASTKIELTLIRWPKFIVAGLGWLIMAFLFWRLTVASDILRDRDVFATSSGAALPAPNSPPTGGLRAQVDAMVSTTIKMLFQKAPKGLPPYSLAKCQMAAWLFVVVTSFLFIYLITFDYNDVLTQEAVMLIGIATGTTLGAAVIEVGKQASAQTDRQALETERAPLDTRVRALETREQALTAAQPQDQAAIAQNAAELAAARQKRDEVDQKLARMGDAKTRTSKDFLSDLLTDANGITLHRFQMLVWTVILILLFLIEVHRTLAMPKFDGTLLALMGISAGTYLGFKIPERQP